MDIIINNIILLSIIGAHCNTLYVSEITILIYFTISALKY